MPGLGAPPNAVVNPDVSSLIGLAAPVVEPRSTAMLTDAFRQGFITSDDILERVGTRAREKKKLELAQTQQALADVTDPALVEARRNTQLAAGAQAKGALDRAPLEQKAREAELKAAIYDAQATPGGFNEMQKALSQAGYPVAIDTNTGLTDSNKAEITKRFAALAEYTNRKTEAESRVKNTEQKFFPTKNRDEAGNTTEGQLQKLFKDGQEVSSDQLKSWVHEAEALRKTPFSAYYSLQSLKPGQVVAPTPAPAVAPVAPAPAPALPPVTQSIEQLKAKRAQIAGALGPVQVSQMSDAEVQAWQPPAAPAPVAPTAAAAPPTGTSFVTGVEAPVPTRPLQEQAMQSALMANKNIQNSDAANAAYVPIQHLLKAVQPDGSYPASIKDKKLNDFSLIVGLAKILDPQSVTREGEIANVKNAQSLLVKYGINPASLEDAVGIATGQQYFSNVGRTAITSLIESAYGQHLENARNITADNANEAARLSLNPALAVGPSRFKDLESTGWKIGDDYTPRSFTLGVRGGEITQAGAPTSGAQGSEKILTAPSGRRIIEVSPGKYRVIQ